MAETALSWLSKTWAGPMKESAMKGLSKSLSFTPVARQ